MNIILAYKLIRLTGFLVLACGVGYLAIFYFGVFKNKTISNIHEKIATGYALIAIGLLIEALEMWYERYQIKWITKFLVNLSKNQYLNYLIVAGIFLLLAIYQYWKSLKLKVNEQ